MRAEALSRLKSIVMSHYAQKDDRVDSSARGLIGP